MKKCLFILLFICCAVISLKAQHKEKYVHLYDSSTQHDYRIRYGRTRVMVQTTDPQLHFFDKIVQADESGVYLKKNGFISYKQVDFLRFKPYTVTRQKFLPVYYIITGNAALFWSLYPKDRFIAGIIILTVPVWAIAVPLFTNIVMIGLTHNEVIKLNNVKVIAGNKLLYD